jgi:hypothetical protein
VKQGQTSVKKLARLLEIAAKKQNESANAASSVAGCLDRSDGDLSDKMFDSVFETVLELSRLLREGKPDFERAALELIAKVT